MKTINQDLFKPGLQYTQEKLEKINDICEPLKYFGIKNFGYWRYYNDGHYICISNNRIYQEICVCYDFHFRSKYFSKQSNYLFDNDFSKLIWPDNVIDKSIEMIRANGVHNGLNIVKRGEGLVEVYFFSTDNENLLVKDLYINHYYIIEEFITYFHKVGKDLYYPFNSKMESISPHLQKTYPYIENIFKGNNVWEKELFGFRLLINKKIQEEIKEIGRRNSLSPRELQCLSHASTGMTAKEIAKSLGIGYRTIETHLNKARVKTGCQTKRELKHWFEDKFKFVNNIRN